MPVNTITNINDNSAYNKKVKVELVFDTYDEINSTQLKLKIRDCIKDLFPENLINVKDLVIDEDVPYHNYEVQITGRMQSLQQSNSELEDNIYDALKECIDSLHDSDIHILNVTIK